MQNNIFSGQGFNKGIVWTPGTRKPDGKPMDGGSEKIQPFTNPDVFRPSYPSNPDGNPEFPLDQPKWLPPAVPSGPIIEIPFDFPKELPPFEQPEWITPSPKEIPDWGQMPLELPQPGGPEVNIPKQFPGQTFPDGVWYIK